MEAYVSFKIISIVSSDSLKHEKDNLYSEMNTVGNKERSINFTTKSLQNESASFDPL